MQNIQNRDLKDKADFQMFLRCCFFNFNLLNKLEYVGKLEKYVKITLRDAITLLRVTNMIIMYSKKNLIIKQHL